MHTWLADDGQPAKFVLNVTLKYDVEKSWDGFRQRCGAI